MRANKPALHSKASVVSRNYWNKSRYKPDGGRAERAKTIEQILADSPLAHPPEPHPTPEALTPYVPPKAVPVPPLPAFGRVLAGTPAARPRIRACDVAVVAAIAFALASLAVYLLMR
jgi:hypothetical protein